jgi:hypothetical protein
MAHDPRATGRSTHAIEVGFQIGAGRQYQADLGGRKAFIKRPIIGIDDYHFHG